MPDQEKWVSLAQAVAIVKAAAGLSQGPAQRTLIAICESGDVRAQWTDHYLRGRPAIHKRDWIGADIDWANFRVVKADRAGMLGVDFSEEDLSAWAALQPPSAPKGARGRHFNSRTARAFVENFLVTDPSGTLDGVREAAQAAGYIGREMIDTEYRNQKALRGDNVRPGRRSKAKA